MTQPSLNPAAQPAGLSGERLLAFLSQARSALRGRVLVQQSTRVIFWIGLILMPLIAMRRWLGLNAWMLLAGGFACTVASAAVLWHARRTKIEQVVGELGLSSEGADRIGGALEFIADPDPFKQLAVRQTERWLAAQEKDIRLLWRWPWESRFTAGVIALLIALWWFAPPAAHRPASAELNNAQALPPPTPLRSLNPAATQPSPILLAAQTSGGQPQPDTTPPRAGSSTPQEAASSSATGGASSDASGAQPGTPAGGASPGTGGKPNTGGSGANAGGAKSAPGNSPAAGNAAASGSNGHSGSAPAGSSGAGASAPPPPRTASDKSPAGSVVPVKAADAKPNADDSTGGGAAPDSAHDVASGPADGARVYLPPDLTPAELDLLPPGRRDALIRYYQSNPSPAPATAPQNTR